MREHERAQLPIDAGHHMSFVGLCEWPRQIR
jgi:hypothetical protein